MKKRWGLIALLVGFVAFATWTWGDLGLEPEPEPEPGSPELPAFETDPVGPVRTVTLTGVPAHLTEMPQPEESTGTLQFPPLPATTWFDPFFHVESSSGTPSAGAAAAGFFDPSITPPALLKSFPGRDFTLWVPPQPHGAAGPDHLVAVMNGGVGVFDKDNGNLLYSASLNQFWSPLLISGQVFFSNTVNPRVLYDQYSGRWIVMSFSDANTTNAHTLLGVSSVHDPFQFDLFAFKSDPNSLRWPSRPGLGVDPQRIYFSASMFPFNSGGHQARIWVLEKESLFDANPTVVHEFRPTGFSRTWQPAHAFGPTSVNFAVSEGWSTIFAPQLLRIVEFSSAIGGQPQMRHAGFIEVDLYGLIPTPDAPQKDCAVPVDVIGERIQNAVLRNGKLWTVHTVDSRGGQGQFPKAELSWYEIDPAQASETAPWVGPLRQGRIGDPELHLFNPSIAVNADETMAIGFNGSSPNHYPGAYYALLQPGDPPGLMPPIGVLREGDGPYRAELGTTNAWGTYSATVVDPDDDRTFWTLQEYAQIGSAPGCFSRFAGLWGTWWGSFRTCESNVDCGDDGFCNGDEFCDPTIGHCRAGEEFPCQDDGDPCTSETCDEVFGGCHAPIPDSDGDGWCDAADNCSLIANPEQDDFDGDGRGDLCDICPTASDPLQSESDGDGIGDACDVCPSVQDPLQEDFDRDGRGDICDNCPTAKNYDQKDENGDGDGNACQPMVEISGFLQDGGSVVWAETVLHDPQGEELTGTVGVEFFEAVLDVANSWPDLDCSLAADPGVGQDSRILYVEHDGSGFLIDAGQGLCTSGTALEFALGECGDQGLGFLVDGIELTGETPPFGICLRSRESSTDSKTFIVAGIDSETLSLRSIRSLIMPFSGFPLPNLDLTGLLPGVTARLEVEATDGVTRPTRDQGEFISLGESMVVFDLNETPVADAGPDQDFHCIPPDGVMITLDGSGSIDPDGSAGEGTGLDFAWWEDYGLVGESLLGIGPVVSVTLMPGIHDVTLQVTDSQGVDDFDEMVVTVIASANPVLSLTPSHQPLWPPNHRLVDITMDVQAAGFCSAPTIVLESVTSNEPDDAAGSGDGRTVDDIRLADVGTDDLQFQLRAERTGGGTGRTYRISYSAVDTTGEIATETVQVFVPHDLGGMTEPVTLSVFESGPGAVVDWNEVNGAIRFNVVRGEMKRINERNDDFHLGALDCISTGTIATDTVGFEDQEFPPIGEAFFYLVEYFDGEWSSYGTESAAKPRFNPPGQTSCH